MRLYFITASLFITLLLGCCAMGYGDTQEALERVYYSEDGV